MSLYSVNSLAILKRIDLKRLPIATSVIASRSIGATSPSSLPAATSPALKNTSKQQKSDSSDQFAFLRDLPFWTNISQRPSTDPNITFKSESSQIPSIETYKPEIIFPLQIPKTPKPKLKKETSTSFIHDNLSEPCDRVFIQNQLEKELKISSESCKHILLLHSSELLEQYSTKCDLIRMCNFVKMFFTGEQLQHNPRVLFLPFNILFHR